MTELLVFCTEGEDVDDIIQGYALMDGEGLAEALDALLNQCVSAETNGQIVLSRFGRYSGRPCISVEWSDDGLPVRVYDIAGRSHSTMIGGHSLADIVTDAVLAKWRDE